MGSVSSGIGLISGIDIQGVVDQLMAIEARPRALVQQRLGVIQAQKTAFLDINARLLALSSASKSLGSTTLFRSRTATSSNEQVLSATASPSAAAGTYSIAVSRLVSTQQFISKGLADPDTTALGAATIRIDSAAARLDTDPKLADLNGGAGVQRGTIRVTDRTGASADIDLSTAVTIDDVVRAINNAPAIAITASLDGDNLLLTDTSGSGSGSILVQDLGLTTTATDLGIAGTSGGADTLTGTQINAISTDTALSLVNDGTGVRSLGIGQNDFQIDLDGSSFDISLGDAGATTIGQVIDAINDHASNPGVTAQVAADGVSIELAGAGTITVTALNGSNAAADLGIDGISGAGTASGGRILAALGSRLIANLNGGAGATLGTIQVTNRTGGATNIDLSGGTSVSDIIAAINAAGAGVKASLNSAGNGILITDTTGSTASNLIITDQSGTAAADLGIDTGVTGVAANSVNGGDRDLRYLSQNTRLDTLNGGRGIASGSFTIVDSNGVSAVVDLSQGNEVTIQDVISEINSRPTDIVATINATGDGILLTDTAGGPARMRVEEAGSTTAADLRLLGEDEDDDGVIDGSFETAITIDATDTLEDIVTKLNDSAATVSASIINDGTGGSPYRLNIASTRSGAAGRLLIDDGGLNLGLSTLVRGQDAVVLFGSDDPTQALLLTSPTNTLDDTIQGVDITLGAKSDTAVQLTIAEDDESVVAQVTAVVDAFNDVMDTFDKYDTFDEETNERGLLLSDSTVVRIRQQLLSLVSARIDAPGSFKSLTQVGIRVGSGGRMELDEAKLRNAIAADRDSVESLFNAVTTEAVTPPNLPAGVSIPDLPDEEERDVGFARLLESLVESFTDSVDGTIAIRDQAFDRQIKLANDRIDSLNELLAAKRARLEAEFFAMERALALIQSQQSALTSLANIAAQAGNRSSGGSRGLLG